MKKYLIMCGASVTLTSNGLHFIEKKLVSVYIKSLSTKTAKKYWSALRN